MNERIKKLKEQATSYTWNGNDVTEELHENKFAELIVRECMNVLAESREVRQIAYYYRNKIAKHFGGEE